MASIFPVCEVTGAWEFVCELHYWPVVHFITPFLLYTYFRSVMLNIVMIFVFEYFEALLVTAFGNYYIFLADDTLGGLAGESVGDSLLSDGTMGLLGTFTAVGCVLLFRLPNNTPPRWKGYWKKWLKYLGQLLLLVLPQMAIQLYFASGLFSYGYTIMTFTIPGFIILFYYWNRKDPKYVSQTDHSPPDSNSKVKKVTSYSLTMNEGYGFMGAFSLAAVVFMFLASFTWRYGSVFFMTLIHGGAFFIFTWISYWCLKYSTRARQKVEGIQRRMPNRTLRQNVNQRRRVSARHKEYTDFDSAFQSMIRKE